MVFVNTMRRVFPIFDEKDNHGHHKQQDADELFQSMLQAWRGPLKTANDGQDIIGNLFEIELSGLSSCAECPDELPT